MAKGLIKDSTLTAIADAIREKTETTGTMLPSEMAALIQGITGSKFAWGTYVNTLSRYSSITITHGLGVIPNLILLLCNTGITTNMNVINYSFAPTEQHTNMIYLNKNAGSAPGYGFYTEPALTTTTMTLTVPSGGYYYAYSATYIWMAGVVEV